MKRVLVTGGARGIGRAIAERFASEGHTVIAPSRADMDLADPEQIERFMDGVGDVDVLVNNAGENVPLAIEDIGVADLQRIIAVNETAPFLLMRRSGAQMAERGWGRIVNISSVYSLISRPKRTMYTTTKSALNGATKAFAVELGPRGVLVNAVCPGFVDTDLTRQNNTPAEIEGLRSQVPLGRLASPQEIADVVYYLGSERNTYITGQCLVVDGGYLSK
jgi:3-oxoacyl-[acyl-carrier protein] reductase